MVYSYWNLTSIDLISAIHRLKYFTICCLPPEEATFYSFKVAKKIKNNSWHFDNLFTWKYQLNIQQDGRTELEAKTHHNYSEKTVKIFFYQTIGFEPSQEIICSGNIESSVVESRWENCWAQQVKVFKSMKHNHFYFLFFKRCTKVETTMMRKYLARKRWKLLKDTIKWGNRLQGIFGN